MDRNMVGSCFVKDEILNNIGVVSVERVGGNGSR